MSALDKIVALDTKCNWCNETFKFTGLPYSDETISVSGVVGTLHITGTLETSSSHEVNAEAYVSCPHCKANNKFNVTLNKK